MHKVGLFSQPTFVLNPNSNFQESLHLSHSASSSSSSSSQIPILIFSALILNSSQEIMVKIQSFLLPFLILLRLNAQLCTASSEKQTLSLNKRNLIVPPSLPPKARRESGAIILEMKHKAYSARPITDWNRILQKRLISDEIRVRSLQSRFRNRVSGQVQGLLQTQVPLTSGVKLETLNYVVTVKLGGKNSTVIVDSGSDLTWVQCQPCRFCYNQQEPLFNPYDSPSYKSIECNSTTCKSLLFATGNSGLCGTRTNRCYYAASYGDGSYTRGELANDSLALGQITIDNFVFGCGRNNKGLFGGASGLMGLGRSSLSMISQTFDLFKGIFSYCLPSTVTESKSSGSLIFGGNTSVYQNSTPISYTRLVSNPMLSTFYFLNLTGISIGGVVLESPALGQSGILIDSGTVISRLPPSIYTSVKAEFIKQFSGFPPAPGFSILDTCFNLTGYEEVDIPTIRMYFEDSAELAVDVTGVFYFVKEDASQICLALARLSYEDDIGIIGNYQQRNTRVVYDTNENKVGFARETCNFLQED